MAEREIPKHYSHSQISHHCGLQLKFHRERVAGDFSGVGMAYGKALHKGLEMWANGRIDGPLTEATIPDQISFTLLRAETAYAQLEAEAKQKGQPIAYDEKPEKVKKNGEPYAADALNIYNVERVKALLGMHVREFVKATQEQSVSAAEREFKLQLNTASGPQEIRGVIDRIDSDEVITDYKTARRPWDAKKVQESKHQAYLYQAAFRQEFGSPPKRFEFVVFNRTGPAVQVFPIPWDADAINTYLNLTVRPTIAAAEAGIYVPNTSGYWCSAKFCPWWKICPLGAATQEVKE